MNEEHNERVEMQSPQDPWHDEQPPPTPDDELLLESERDKGVQVLGGFMTFYFALAASCVAVAGIRGHGNMLEAMLDACIPALGLAILISLGIGVGSLFWLRSGWVLKGVWMAILSLVGLAVLAFGACFALATLT
ncbi:MAG: hypothetical protein GC159_02195 [Phycisphaera sp.]|nr:hypothetical protein [Phycisphaera sp.]